MHLIKVEDASPHIKLDDSQHLHETYDKNHQLGYLSERLHGKNESLVCAGFGM